MEIQKIVKWSLSGRDACPAVYDADNGDVIVQGWKIDADTRLRLEDVAPDEDAVRVPANLLTDYFVTKTNYFATKTTC